MNANLSTDNRLLSKAEDMASNLKTFEELIPDDLLKDPLNVWLIWERKGGVVRNKKILRRVFCPSLPVLLLQFSQSVFAAGLYISEITSPASVGTRRGFLPGGGVTIPTSRSPHA